jgi:O-antigen ligase
VYRFFLAACLVFGTVELIDLLGLNPFSEWIRQGPRFRYAADATILSATQGAIFAMPFLYLSSTVRTLGNYTLPGMMAAVWCCVLSVLSASRGVWLGLIGTTTGLVWFLEFRRKIAILVTFALAGAFAWVFIKSFYVPRYDMRIGERIVSMVDLEEGNARWRLNAWQQMIDDIRYHPFTGWPFGTQPSFIVYYGAMHVEQHAPHNEYLKVARYTGLFGLAAFLWFVIGVFVQGFRFMLRHRDQDCYYEVLGLLLCFLFHVITAIFTQAFTTMDRSPIVWAIPGIVALYLLTERGNGTARAPVR